MNIAEICSRRPTTASASAPLSDVARLMYENHVGTVVLTQSPADRAVPAGILTDRDIIRAQIEHGADLSRLPAWEQMTRDPLSVCEDVPVEEALSLMRKRGVRRAIVLDKSGALAGVVSIDDIILSLAAEVAAIGKLLEAQAVHGT